MIQWIAHISINDITTALGGMTFKTCINLAPLSYLVNEDIHNRILRLLIPPSVHKLDLMIFILNSSLANDLSPFLDLIQQCEGTVKKASNPPDFQT